MIANVAALILALAKALPAIERLLAEIEQKRADARAAELHHAIDDAIANARKGAPVCPRADCPLRDRRLLNGAGAVTGGAPAQTS